jgi:predicted transcriptional regulator
VQHYAAKNMTSKHRITVNLSDDEAEALSELAEKSRVSKAWLGRHAICSLIERTKEGDYQLPLLLQAGGSQ